MNSDKGKGKKGASTTGMIRSKRGKEDADLPQNEGDLALDAFADKDDVLSSSEEEEIRTGGLSRVVLKERKKDENDGDEKTTYQTKKCYT